LKASYAAEAAQGVFGVFFLFIFAKKPRKRQQKDIASKTIKGYRNHEHNITL